MKQVSKLGSSAFYLLHAGFLDPEDGGGIFLQNVAWFLTDFTTLYPRRYNS
jgi:hypothetical protein